MLNLKEIREEQLLSKEFICKLLNLSIEEYTLYENDMTGNKLLKNEVLLRQLTKIFGITKNDLFVENLKIDDYFCQNLEFFNDSDKLQIKNVILCYNNSCI